MSNNINIEQTIEEVDINNSSTVEDVEPITISVEETIQYVNVNVDETVETVTIELAEAPYIPITWTDYVFQYKPSTETPITGGTVIQYTADLTVYRFIPEPYVYADDAFYSNFDGTVVSNLLVRRI